MDIYENKKESFRRKFENMSDLSVRELTYGDMKICIFYISNFCSKNMIASQVIEPIAAAYVEYGSVPEEVSTLHENVELFPPPCSA